MAGKMAKCVGCAKHIRIPAAKQPEEVEVIDAELAQPEALAARPMPVSPLATAEKPFGQNQNRYPAGRPRNTRPSNTSAWDRFQEKLWNWGRNPTVLWSALGVSILLCLTVCLMPLGLVMLYHSVKAIILSNSEGWKKITTYQQAKKKFEQNRGLYLTINVLEYFLVPIIATIISIPIILMVIWGLAVAQ